MWGYGPDWGMMQGGWGAGAGIFHMVFWIVVLIAIVVVVLWLVRSMSAGGQAGAQGSRSSGLAALEERYARGEIKREEFLEKKRDLGG